MTLPFLSKEANEEFVLRMERASEPEGQRYREGCGEVRQDHEKRGMRDSTLCSGALVEAEIEHVRRLTQIWCEELFHIVEAEEVRLTGEHETAIIRELKLGIEARFTQLESESLRHHPDAASQAAVKRGLKYQKSAVIHAAIAAVRTRIADIRRNERREFKERCWKHIEKLIYALIGVVLTLLTQFLSKRMGW